MPDLYEQVGVGSVKSTTTNKNYLLMFPVGGAIESFHYFSIGKGSFWMHAFVVTQSRQKHVVTVSERCIWVTFHKSADISLSVRTRSKVIPLKKNKVLNLTSVHCQFPVSL